MKNNEFFKALKNKEETTRGEDEALNAWFNGIHEKLDFPFLKGAMWQEEIADFLKAIKEAGFNKFGFHAISTLAVENIVAFTKAGWKLTGVFEFNEYRTFEGLIFEK